LPVSPKALFHNPNLVTFAPVPPAPAIRGRKDFNLGSALMVGHKVGLITGVKISSDGLHRRDTVHRLAPGPRFALSVGLAPDKLQRRAKLFLEHNGIDLD